MNAKKELFASNGSIEEIIDLWSKEITQLEEQNGIPQGYLRTALALHLPRFSDKDLDSEDVINKELSRLVGWKTQQLKDLPKDLISELLRVKKQSKLKAVGAEILEIDFADKLLGIAEFKKVTPAQGLMIQSKLHYIGCARSDTKYHFGLFRKGAKHPFAYAAYSESDRDYMISSLPFDITHKETLVLTRSFSVNSSPVNSMSLLFGMCHRYFLSEFPGSYRAIVTAINPNVLFRGISFKGAAFFSYATMPYSPSYLDDQYITRRAIKGGAKGRLAGSEMDCKRSVLMAHALDRHLFGQLRDTEVYEISEKQYGKM